MTLYEIVVTIMSAGLVVMPIIAYVSVKNNWKISEFF